MTEYVVDSVSSGTAKGHYIGDAPNPTEEPETHFFKKPMEERLALRTRQRAAEGWRLVATSGAQREGGFIVFLFFERETRTPSRQESTRLDEPVPRPAAPIQVGPAGGSETHVPSASPAVPPAARPTPRASAPTGGGFIEKLRRAMRGD